MAQEPEFIRKKREEMYGKLSTNFPGQPLPNNPVITPGDVKDEIASLLNQMGIAENSPEYKFITDMAFELFKQNHTNSMPTTMPALRKDLKAEIENAQLLQTVVDVLQLKQECDELQNKLKIAPKEDVAELKNQLTLKLEKLNKLTPALSPANSKYNDAKKVEEFNKNLNKNIASYKETLKKDFSKEPDAKNDKENEEDLAIEATPASSQKRDDATELNELLLGIGILGQLGRQHFVENLTGIPDVNPLLKNDALSADTNDPNNPIDTPEEANDENKKSNPWKPKLPTDISGPEPT